MHATLTRRLAIAALAVTTVITTGCASSGSPSSSSDGVVRLKFWVTGRERANSSSGR